LSSPDHLFPEVQSGLPSEAVTAPAEIPTNPGAENPPWSGLDLLLIGLVLVAALFIFSSLFFVLALHSSALRGLSPSLAGISPAELSKNPGPLVIVPSMTLAYLAMVVAMYMVVKRRHGRSFWQSVGWRWPSGWWPGYMIGGGLLALGLGLLSRLLPIPKSLPMDQFFKDRQGAYLMMLFGVAVVVLAQRTQKAEELDPALYADKEL